MRAWSAAQLAHAAGAELLRAPDLAGGPAAASIDSRALGAGELFVGLRGERDDGGRHAADALRAGAWGVLVSPQHAEAAVAAQSGAVLAHEDPLAGMQALASAWREHLGERGAHVIAITGSTGKTSTKDILAALLSRQLRVTATPANLNTEIGLPLVLLAAPEDTQALVLEMAMRGVGQIAELTAIARPDVGVVVNVGPAHLELLGSIEAIAAAKAELIAGLAAGAHVVIPAGEPLLTAHLRAELHTTTFGEGGDVQLLERRSDGTVVVAYGQRTVELLPSFEEAHNLQNLLAAVAAAAAIGEVAPGALDVEFSALRGQRTVLADGLTVIDDCYNANPMSMASAIDELAVAPAARRVAVLGEMLELGPEAPLLHREVGRRASAGGVDLLVAVGALGAEIAAGFDGVAHEVPDAHAAAELVPGLLRSGDTVLVKGSRGVGLEVVGRAIADSLLAPSGGPDRGVDAEGRR
jgi:UDP-N-acetylmuramoyl-tripeptide--D-alanyl-D-alanine ligase